MNESNSELETSSKSSALAQVINLFAAPGQALDYARERPGMWWLPLGIVILFNAVLSLWWALTVNLNALHMEQLQIITRMRPEVAERAGQYIMHQGRGSLIIGVVVALVMLGVIELLYALYLFLADKLFSADSRRFGQWFSFTTWTWLPLALAGIAGIVVYALSSHGTNVQLTDVTTLNTLFFHLKPWDHLFRVAQFSILNFWVIALVTYGLKRWRGHGTGKALAIAVAPYVVIYAIMYFV